MERNIRRTIKKKALSVKDNGKVEDKISSKELINKCINSSSDSSDSSESSDSDESSSYTTSESEDEELTIEERNKRKKNIKFKRILRTNGTVIEENKRILLILPINIIVKFKSIFNYLGINRQLNIERTTFLKKF